MGFGWGAGADDDLDHAVGVTAYDQAARVDLPSSFSSVPPPSPDLLGEGLELEPEAGPGRVEGGGVRAALGEGVPPAPAGERPVGTALAAAAAVRPPGGCPEGGEGDRGTRVAEGVVGYAAVVGVGAYLVCDGVVLEPPVLAQRGRGGGGEVLQLDVAIGVVARGGGPGGGGDVLLLGVDLAVGVGFVGAEDHH